MPTMSLKHKLNLLSHFVREARFREIYNMFWVYPLWWNRKTAAFLLNKFLPRLGIDLFPPFLEIEPTTICNFKCVCCIPGEQKILADFPKDIEELVPSNRVLNSKGNFQKISETFKRKYSGKLAVIHAEGILPIKLTPEHRLLVSKRIWKDSPRNNRSYEYSDKFEFIEAKNLTKEHSLVFPKLMQKSKWNEKFPLSKELVAFLGIYLAEGYVSAGKRKRKGKVIGNQGSIRLSFGKHEEKLIKETSEIILKAFNKKTCIVKRDSTIDVCFFSVEIAKWLLQFGSSSREKHIPYFLMNLDDRELIHTFIEWFIKGDGYKNPNYLQLTTSSKVLALQMQKLLSRLDIFSGLYENKREGISFIQGRKVNIHNIYNIRITGKNSSKFLDIKNSSKRKINLYCEKNNYFLLPVKKLSFIPYNGYVYNLETKDKTFEYHNVVVHNCEHSYWKEPSINMSFSDFKKIFDSFGKPKWLGLTGIGSSYLNKDYHKMLAYAKSKGTIVEVFDHFAHFKNDGEIKELIKIGPDFQFISTYGATKKSFEKVCVGSDYAKIEENIKKFVSFKKQMKTRFPILNFHYIITKESKEEVLDFLDFLHSLKTEIGEVLVTPMLHTFKEAEKFAIEIDENYVKKIKTRADKYKIPITINMSAKQQAEGLEKKPSMNNCKEYIMPFIFVTGHVTPCCGQNEANARDWQKQMSLGNALQKPFREIWYSPKYKKMRESIRKNSCPQECALCPAYEKNFPKGLNPNLKTSKQNTIKLKQNLNCKSCPSFGNCNLK
ncbi:MAG: SPASM domain-containing protein [Candidatus Nanoarchaeia archaeon]